MLVIGKYTGYPKTDPGHNSLCEKRPSQSLIIFKKKETKIMKNTNSKLILTGLLSFAVIVFAYGQKKAHKER
jgi:hypothetical protein